MLGIALRRRWVLAWPRRGRGTGGAGLLVWAGHPAPAPAPPRARSWVAGRLDAEQKPGTGGLSAARTGMRALLQPPLPGRGAVRPDGR